MSNYSCYTNIKEFSFEKKNAFAYFNSCMWCSDLTIATEYKYDSRKLNKIYLINSKV